MEERCPRLTPAPILAHMVEGRKPLQLVHLVVQPLYFSPGGLVSHELDSGYICPSIQPRGSLLVALVNHPLHLFPPDSVVCRNILWRMNGWWFPPAFHWGYSPRNRSTSRWNCASLTDSPSLSPALWQPEICATYHCTAAPIKHGY